MKDIFNREIKDGSFVIVKPTGRDSHGLHLGVIVGERVMLRRYDWDPYIAKYDQYYLVENPTQLEIEYINKMKQDYQKVLDKRQEEKNNKNKALTIKKKDMIIGKSYDDRGIYVGRIEVIEPYGDIEIGIYDNCFVKYNTYSNKSFDVSAYQTVSGSSANSIFSSTKAFPKIYKMVDTPEHISIDSLIKKMRSRKEYINNHSIYRTYIPKLKLLDLGADV